MASEQKDFNKIVQDSRSYLLSLVRAHISSANVTRYGIFLMVFWVISISSPYYRTGNIFFGEVESLYNVRLAQFFFERSAQPLIGREHPFAHYQLSRTYFIQGNLESALDEAYKELDVYPENMRTYFILGLTLGYMHEEEKAIEAFQKFIEWKPESWAARNDCAWLQFRIDDIDGALETIGPVTKQTTNPWVQNTYAVLLMNKDRFDEAKQALIYAQEIISTMTEESWGMAYPGNDPRIYDMGLQGMKTSIKENLQLLGG